MVPHFHIVNAEFSIRMNFYCCCVPYSSQKFVAGDYYCFRCMNLTQIVKHVLRHTHEPRFFQHTQWTHSWHVDKAIRVTSPSTRTDVSNAVGFFLSYEWLIFTLFSCMKPICLWVALLTFWVLFQHKLIIFAPSFRTISPVMVIDMNELLTNFFKYLCI